MVVTLRMYSINTGNFIIFFLFHSYLRKKDKKRRLVGTCPLCISGTVVI